ncbi:MAG: CHAT domain-containing protein [Saprospiraceae bacterium]|nr:CHAT domain-containing protein [Saprospiraceae bacterium]
MIRSGLILAGGNHAWQTGKPLKPSMEDGILTAYEISQNEPLQHRTGGALCLRDGLGRHPGNEGVYGLQRAFKIAGAKYLVMALWQVPDSETSVFMTTFTATGWKEK